MDRQKKEIEIGHKGPLKHAYHSFIQMSCSMLLGLMDALCQDKTLQPFEKTLLDAALVAGIAR
jgi:hypothetical protein